MSRQSQVRLNLNDLETRDVPATATVFNGVLDIRGTFQNDSIIIREINGRYSVANTPILYNGRFLASISWQAVGRIFVDAGAGNDTIDASGVQNRKMVVIGGSGDDFIRGTAKVNHIYGRDGDDTIIGGSSNDLLFGENGNDVIRGEGGRDTIYGGNGDDDIDGGEGDDLVRGEYGDDLINGGNGNDRLEGGDGDDTIDGAAGNDLIYGQHGNDSIMGGTGNDRLFGQTGNDYIRGGDGDDIIAGGDGGDLLFGDDGADVLYAGEPGDVLNGGDGNDTLIGGGNGDILVGGETTNEDDDDDDDDDGVVIPPQPPANSQALVTNIRAQWVDGLTAEVQVSNISPIKANSWRIEFDAKFNITNIWNARIVSAAVLPNNAGFRYIIEGIPNFFNAAINPNSQVSFGYNAQFPANTSLAITNQKLNGTAVSRGF